MRAGSAIITDTPAWCRSFAAGRHSARWTAIRPASLPPPPLSGSAASNPRSVFNPLALAYLGDAVWEAHTRLLETYLEAWSAQVQEQQQLQQQHPAEPRGSGGRGRGRGRAARGGRSGLRGGGWAGQRAGAAGGEQRQPGDGSTGPGGGGNSYGLNADPGHGGGGLAEMSRQARREWATANFQARVFDALSAGGLPPPAPGALPPGFQTTCAPGPRTGPQGAAPAPSPGQRVYGLISAPIGTEASASALEPPVTDLVATTASPQPPPTPASESQLGRATQPAAPSDSTSSAGEGGDDDVGGGGGTAGFVLTAAEADVLRWGRNAAVSSAPKDMPVGVYKKATAVEVLVAHMYLTDPRRCAALVAAAVAAPLAARNAGEGLGPGTASGR